MKRKILKTINAIYPSLIYLGISFLTAIVLMIVISINKGYTDSDSFMEIGRRYGLHMTALSALISMPIMLILKYFDDKKPYINLKRTVSSVSFREYFIFAFSAIGACIFLNTLISITGLVKFDKKFLESIGIIYQTSILMQLISAGFIIPIIEELIFRELMFRRLRDAYNTTTAMIISALAFAIFHGNITQGFYAFVLGLFLAYVYKKRESILLCILIHVIANTTSIIISTDMAKKTIYSNIIPIVVVTAIAFILWIGAIFYLVINDFKINTKEDKEGEIT